jgi:hypothetical protein
MERDDRHEEIKRKRRLLQERTDGVNRRRARLEIARRTMMKEKVSHTNLQAKLSQIQNQCAMIRSKAQAKRVDLLDQLDFIYPVELVDGATLLFSIVGIPLANRMMEEQTGRNADRENDDVVSSALGMIGQVVGLLSVYLDTPIHYPIATAGSRSIIQDSISVMSGPRAFPLYSKGVESYRFEYGVFLLNKNIEQLLNHFGITILDIRNTLPNLKNLLVTLSASAQFSTSRLSRKNLNGSETISLKADHRPVAILSTTGTAAPTASSTENHASSNHEKRGRGSSGWGMSLLGWNSSNADAATPAPSLDPTTATPSHMIPVVRTFGST